MPSPSMLRIAGPDYVTEVLRQRPDVLEPVLPLTLVELAARLGHPVSLSRALSRLPQPALEVLEALAALGPHTDETALAELLGAGTPARREALDQELDRLRRFGLLPPDSLALEPLLAEQYATPLQLGVPLKAQLEHRTVPELQKVAAAWGVTGGKQPRRMTLVDALQQLFADPARIRTEVAKAPRALLETLEQAAFGLRVPTGYGSFYGVTARGGNDREQALTWALERMILVRRDAFSVQMPDPVALALRGVGWHAPFTPKRPDGEWQQLQPRQIDSSASVAVGAAHQALSDVLRFLHGIPLKRRKDGAVGARELRRLAKAVGGAPERIPMLLGLAYAARLVELHDDLVVTAEGLEWAELEPAQALTAVLSAWMTLPDIPADQEDLTWLPSDRPGVPDLRRTMLHVLAEHPCAAAQATTLHDLLTWERPVLLGRSLYGPIDGAPTGVTIQVGWDGYDTDGYDMDVQDESPSGALEAMLTEAAFLGIVAEGALSSLGQAMVSGAEEDGASVEAVLQTLMGEVQREVVLQADLTATVLGQAGGALTTTLDRLADRESRSVAAVWRFTPASIRRALDTGAVAEQILADLDAISTAGVPQPLNYLVRDVARKHGSLRAGSAVSYIRSEDESLLAEVAADRRLRAHQLTLLAPTVLASTTSLDGLLEALRSAGYAPVQEGAGGATVLERAHAPARKALRDKRSAVVTVPRTEQDDRDLVTRLMAAPDSHRSLLHLGHTVIDSTMIREYTQALGQNAPLF
ncbi:hypothetical protein Kisp01_67390 [Kineosporia sp. NBRC 101677]|uniref:helicase-associated domain-containing protein n=1 Tax=Kineosporia sp. NBRC 101677 TaxID=3032197 RepID=UPI0024A0A3BA|nr:helicase-associated domain-containing protein [Kineosporia sp. NBRC 101677]GLY19725.1 hypothetical protein Kisp01_67390 [Kineosporia sp. NBRC 101677]